MLPAVTLTMDLMVAAADATEPGSRTRLESCKVLKRLAKLVGIDGTDRLDALWTPYEPREREVPSDEMLAALFADNEGQKWWCLIWELITYGCRLAEAFSLRPNGDGTARVLRVKKAGKLPQWRTALALTVSGLTAERFVSWDVSSPAEYDSLKSKREAERWQAWLRI